MSEGSSFMIPFIIRLNSRGTRNLCRSKTNAARIKTYMTTYWTPLFSQNFCTFRNQILFFTEISRPNFAFYKIFETKLCFLQNFRDQTLFLAKFSEQNFTCKVNRFAIKFCFYKIFRDQTLFFTKFSRPNFVFYKIFETKLCFLQNFRDQTWVFGHMTS